MAKFNTLAGGYYGKLGATVGQRWKNIRTVRTYVVPHNPQTEVQQANRKRFSDCVFYAQLAGQMNSKVTAFDTISKTLWNARMSTARALQDLGLTEMDRIPLYPTSFSVPFVISSASVTQVIDETHIKVTVEGVTFTEERVLTMLLLLPGAEDWKDRLALCIGSNGEGGGNIFTFRLPEGLSIPDGTKARFVSCDDVSSLTDLIASSQIDLPVSAPITREFDTTITALERNGMTFTATLAEPFQSGENSVGTVKAYGVFNGQWRTWTISNAQLINKSGYFAIAFTSTASHPSMIPAFPTGSHLEIESISSHSATLHLDATNKTETMSNSDLTRTYETAITEVTRNNKSFTFTLGYSLPSNTPSGGSWAFKAVSKGVQTTRTNPPATIYTDRIVFNQTTAEDSEIYAFPAGSTVSIAFTFSVNGVTYQPDNTAAQNISSTDLTRTMSPISFSWSSTNGRFEGTFNENATITSGGGTRTATTKNHNQFFQEVATSAVVVSYDGGKITVSSPAINNNTIMLESDALSLTQSETFVSAGVSYVLAAQQVASSKAGTQTLNPALFDITSSLNNDSVILLWEVTDSSLEWDDYPSNTTPHAPTQIEIADGDGGVYDTDIDEVSLSGMDNHSIEIYLATNIGGTSFPTGEDGIFEPSANAIFITDGAGNQWNLPSYRYDLIWEE
jgi:hypothetical protein